jgi:hypothetical protein
MVAIAIGDSLTPNAGGGPGSPMFMDIVPITGPDGTPGYVAGGEEVDALIKAKIGANRTILAVLQLNGDNGANTWHTYYDRANGKLLFYTQDEAEVAGTTDLSTFVTVDHLVISY